MASVLNYFEVFYEKYEQTKNLALLKTDYEERLINCGKQVQVLDPAGVYEGTAQGITEEGKLIVVKEDGSKIQVDSGEVSVRGLYGYV
jgi:BirA family biotin operon repressor/biotin-[acetyl-CoA-carboxylase] ligase